MREQGGSRPEQGWTSSTSGPVLRSLRSARKFFAASAVTAKTAQELLRMGQRIAGRQGPEIPGSSLFPEHRNGPCK